MPLLNNVHSKLNPTEVKKVIKPSSLEEIQEGVRRAKTERLKISMSGIDKVLDAYPNEGIIHCESGIMWPDIIETTH